MNAKSQLSRAGYILTGGKSSRMGADKAFLDFGGRTLLARAIAVIGEVCPNLAIVGDPAKFAASGAVIAEEVFNLCARCIGVPSLQPPRTPSGRGTTRSMPSSPALLSESSKKKSWRVQDSRNRCFSTSIHLKTSEQPRNRGRDGGMPRPYVSKLLSRSRLSCHAGGNG